MTISVLIIGMGFVGRALAESLYQQNIAVDAIKRHLTSDDVNLPIALDAADLNRPVWQAHWTNYTTWVLLLPPSAMADYAATVAWWVQRGQRVGVQHWIYGSSVGVFGATQGVCDERTVPAPSTESGKKVQAAEQLLLNSGATNVDIVRLGGLYAAERHPLYSLLRREMPLSGGNAVAHMIHRDAAVATLVQATLSPNGCRIVHAVEQPALCKRDFYAREAKKLGQPAPVWLDDAPASAKQIISTT
ncbi:SDR family NAD(P)-dependent oxidoreductase [Kingella kingae]|uniref:SDR family NAD(P)-dependent oxidoreductase n=1 Tax=Kingella kingae TaxID=504 RepID=UPI00255088F1|nr:SDR family NAD(P)-dependent oxidoreductase [Kingella kingae]MDK4650688.1 SDR family NAD(P)-dependent oxidoreductase [Kingella kingae]